MSLIEFNDCKNGIGIISFNSPLTRNAMCEGMAEEFAQLTESLATVGGIRVLILTGAGSAFSAGGDFDMLEKKSDYSGEVNRLKMLSFYSAFLGIRKLNVPLIAAINGHAVGAGASLACGMDIRIASSKAKLGFTFSKLGLYPGMGSTFFLRKIIGDAAATELLLTGRIVDAQEAYRLGLLSRIVEEGEDVVEVASVIAKEIIGAGPQTIRQLCAGFRSDDHLLEHYLDRESLCQAISYASEEFKEGVAAGTRKASTTVSLTGRH